MAESPIDVITKRWKVQQQVQTRISNRRPTECPDTRSSYLRLRADLLRSEPKLAAQAPTLEVELATTLDELVETRTENKLLRDEMKKWKETTDRLDEEKAALRSEVDSRDAEIAELRARVEQQQNEMEMLDSRNQKLIAQLEGKLNTIHQQQQQQHTPAPRSAVKRSGSPIAAVGSNATPRRPSPRPTSSAGQRTASPLRKAPFIV